MAKSSWRLLVGFLLGFSLTLAACAVPYRVAEPSPEELAATVVAQTATAGQPRATETASATASPTATATATPIPPTATPTATRTPGPLVVEDDFSWDRGIWLCEGCAIEDGTLRFGPFPVSDAYVQHVAFCNPCGEVTYYRMAVDVTFGEGQSDRGYGLMVSGGEHYLMTYEITPWQTVDLWFLYDELGEWAWIAGQWSGLVRPGRQTNRIEFEVSPTMWEEVGDIALRVNGRTVLVLYKQPTFPGVVGLALYGHDVSVFFDNFEFWTEEQPEPLIEGGSSSLQG